jgi:hypothetical protein
MLRVFPIRLAKFSRKTRRFTCQLSCRSFGRYRELGKVESHPQGVRRGETRIRTTCTLNVQQNSSIALTLGVEREFPKQTIEHPSCSRANDC